MMELRSFNQDLKFNTSEEVDYADDLTMPFLFVRKLTFFLDFEFFLEPLVLRGRTKNN